MTLLDHIDELERDQRSPETALDRPIPVTRRRLDRVLIGAGSALAVVLVVAGALLTWGSGFSADYVGDELGAQGITFPSEESLVAQGREDLSMFAGEQVVTGDHAEAYASYIDGHLDGIGGGMTYAEVPDREAQTAVSEAIEAGAPASEVADLQAEADALSAQRDSLFRGEMLRGALLNAYAWSTLGRIAGIAATVAFVGAGVMALLSLAGGLHLRKVQATR